MTKRKRTILFASLAVLFFLAAPLTVLYSLGWRFDWETKKIIQPGVFYFKVWPKNAQVYLDAKPKKKTDFFFGSILIENLTPKKYEVEIRKEGFHPWQKTLEIKERQVAEAKNIVLIPEDPEFKILAEKVEEFFFSPDQKKVILKEKSPGSPKEEWALKLFELDKNVKSHLINEIDISKKGAQLMDLEFSPDSERILLELGVKEKLEYYLLEIDKPPTNILVGDKSPSLDLGNPDKVYFFPKDSEKLFLLEGGILSEKDILSEKTPIRVLAKNILALSISGNNIYYLDDSGFLFKTDFSFNQKEKLNTLPFSPKKETEYEIDASGYPIFLKEGNVLYIFDKEKGEFEEFFGSVKDFKYSPDFQKMVYYNDYEIWIWFLEKQYSQPQKEAGEKLFLTRFSEKIDEVFWYTNHYLVFKVKNKIKAAEIDDRDKINIVDLSSGGLDEENKEKEIFWNQNNRKLYILTEKNLYQSEKLVP